MTTAANSTSAAPTQTIKRTRWLWIAFAFWQLTPFLLILLGMAIRTDIPMSSTQHPNLKELVSAFPNLLNLLALAIILAQVFMLVSKTICGTSRQYLWALLTILVSYGLFQIQFLLVTTNKLPDDRFQRLFAYLKSQFYLTMPLLSLLIVLVIARLSGFQITTKEERESHNNSFQFSLRDLFITMVLISLLFAIRSTLSKINFPTSPHTFMTLVLNRDAYKWPGPSIPEYEPNPWSYYPPMLLDWTYFLLKSSALVLPLLLLRRNTPLRTWAFLLVVVALSQVLLDRLSIHHKFLYDKNTPIDLWLFSPLQVLHIFLSWYLLTQLGYHFTRSLKTTTSIS